MYFPTDFQLRFFFRWLWTGGIKINLYIYEIAMLPANVQYNAYGYINISTQVHKYISDTGNMVHILSLT